MLLSLPDPLGPYLCKQLPRTCAHKEPQNIIRTRRDTATWDTPGLACATNTSAFWAMLEEGNDLSTSFQKQEGRIHMPASHNYHPKLRVGNLASTCSEKHPRTHPNPHPDKGEDGVTPDPVSYCFFLGSLLGLSADYLCTQVKDSHVCPQSRYFSVLTTRTPECDLSL